MSSSSKVHYEIGANTAATSNGGIAVMHRLVTKVGQVEAPAESSSGR